MKALIFENKVVDVQLKEFEVHSSMIWVDCEDTVKMGFSYDGSTFTSNEPTAEEIAAYEAEQKTKANKKASGKQKLKDLGLDDEEIKVLIG
jgi:hypothetical protein|tara:strand:- start:44 stop:316 length:273 start_codon:yes stop_codon:yes gene_type:complete